MQRTSFAPSIEHDARFTWDDGQGETRCSAAYLERRNFQRVALGRAAEARLLGKLESAQTFEEQARRLSFELAALKKAGHVGATTMFPQGEFRAAFAHATIGDLRVV